MTVDEVLLWLYPIDHDDKETDRSVDQSSSIVVGSIIGSDKLIK